MEAGNLVRATWNDGLVEVGTYVGTERGYIILLSKNKKKIICNPACVKFEVVDA